jgi:hypothetical protein
MYGEGKNAKNLLLLFQGVVELSALGAAIKMRVEMDLCTIYYIGSKN